MHNKRDIIDIKARQRTYLRGLRGLLQDDSTAHVLNGLKNNFQAKKCIAQAQLELLDPEKDTISIAREQTKCQFISELMEEFNLEKINLAVKTLDREIKILQNEVEKETARIVRHRNNGILPPQK